MSRYKKMPKDFTQHQNQASGAVAGTRLLSARVKRSFGAGFTLIEVLVVIAIIGILASIVLASLSSSKAKARDARRLSDMNAIVKALEFYYDANGYYPKTLPSPLVCPFDNRYPTGDNGYAENWLSILAPKYLPTLPSDPSGVMCSTNGYEYCTNSTGQGYSLRMQKENGSQCLIANNNRCGVNWEPPHFPQC